MSYYSLVILGTEVKVHNSENKEKSLLIETETDIYPVKREFLNIGGDGINHDFLTIFDKKMDRCFMNIIQLLYYIFTEIENLEKEKVAGELAKFYSSTFPEITRDFIFKTLPR